MASLRTRVYIDGYNFYYGCLRGAPYKWLDVLNLFKNQILPSIRFQKVGDSKPVTINLDENCSLKYFTAKIIERAAKSDDSVSSQAHYHNALEKHCGNQIRLIMGKYSIYKSNQYLVPPVDSDLQLRDCERVQVWKIEEKKSDVALGLHMFDDALSGEIDQIVLVTNDTDLFPALEMIKNRCPKIVRGLVIPTRKIADKLQRQPNADLTSCADWVKTDITDDELKAAQLPDVISVGKATAKPISWYKNPAYVQQMTEMSRPVLKSEGAIMKWARKECEYLSSKKPIDLLETDEGAQAVFRYIEKYINESK